MKFRTDFVTNSSASSFIVSKKIATKEELKIIQDYCNSNLNYDGWIIKEYPTHISGITAVDNGELWDYIRFVNVRYEIFDIENF